MMCAGLTIEVQSEDNGQIYVLGRASAEDVCAVSDLAEFIVCVHDALRVVLPIAVRRHPSAGGLSNGDTSQPPTFPVRRMIGQNGILAFAEPRPQW